MKPIRGIWLVWLLALAMPAYWAFDRSPPIRLLGYVQPAPARAGDPVTFNVPAAKDNSRSCEQKLSRYLMLPGGIRKDVSSEQVVNSEGLKDMREKMGGFVRITVDIPKDAAPGAAVLYTNISYVCNPLQNIWPIEVNFEFPFEVLP